MIYSLQVTWKIKSNVVKIAIFVEGQTEAVFTRTLISQFFNNAKVSIEIIKLVNPRGKCAHSFSNKNARLYFYIYDVEGDVNVLSAIKERASSIFNKGFKQIISLRDMYSREYDQVSGGRIKSDITQKFIRDTKAEIAKLPNSDKIFFHFAIMEIEAWILAMHKFLRRINPGLTSDKIYRSLNVNIGRIDPEQKFYKPSNELDKIFRLVNRRYRKSIPTAERIMSKIYKQDFERALKSPKVPAFTSYYKSITKGKRRYLI